MLQCVQNATVFVSHALIRIPAELLCCLFSVKSIKHLSSILGHKCRSHHHRKDVINEEYFNLFLNLKREVTEGTSSGKSFQSQSS